MNLFAASFIFLAQAGDSCEWKLESARIGKIAEVSLVHCEACFPSYRIYAGNGETLRSGWLDSVSVENGSYSISFEALPSGTLVLELECGNRRSAFRIQRFVEAGEVRPSSSQSRPKPSGDQ